MPSSFLFAFVSFWKAVHALDNGVALSPPMGWLSWARFGCNTDCVNWPHDCISETLYLEQAQELVDGGYLDAGYRYVNIDDCWSSKERNVDGSITEDPKRFPSGLKSLSQQIHKMGLLFGLYADIGSRTCAGYPGLEGYMKQDAIKFALEYEIDSIKVDSCNANKDTHNITYPAFGDALNKTGRPILYACSWAVASANHGEKPYVLDQIGNHCNQWRNYNDIYDSWASVRGIIKFYTRDNSNDPLVRAAGWGRWNDPDMLLVGNPGLSLSEQQAQFCLWAIFASPLLMSADLRKMPDESRRILLNREVIAVNQDVMGRQGWCAGGCQGNLRVYVRELMPSNGELCAEGQSDVWAIVLANFYSIFAAHVITFDPKQHLPNGDQWEAFQVSDLLLHRENGEWNSSFPARVDESTVHMYKITLRRKSSDTPQEGNRSQSNIRAS